MLKNNVYRTIIKRRTVRRFKQKAISLIILKKLVDAARLAPSAANIQPLEFIIVNKKNLCDEIFKYTRWAGYIAPKGNPPTGKRPTAYIIILANKKIAREYFIPYDAGAAAQNILLCAWEKTIGACWMKAIDYDAITKILKVPKTFLVDSLISLGYRDEFPVIFPAKKSIKYYKDKKGKLHVPKRTLASVVHYNVF